LSFKFGHLIVNTTFFCNNYSADADKPHDAFRGQSMSSLWYHSYVYGLLLQFYHNFVSKTGQRFLKYSTWPWNPG